MFVEEGKDLCFQRRRGTCDSRGGKGPVLLEKGKDLCFYRRGRTCDSIRGEDLCF